MPGGPDVTVPVPVPERSVWSRNDGWAVEADWMMVLLPLERCQTAVAVPSGANPIWGCSAFWPVSERSTAAPKEPPGGRVLAWMI